MTSSAHVSANPRLHACASSAAVELRVAAEPRMTRCASGALSSADRAAIEVAIREAWCRGFAQGIDEAADIVRNTR